VTCADFPGSPSKSLDFEGARPSQGQDSGVRDAPDLREQGIWRDFQGTRLKAGCGFPGWTWKVFRGRPAIFFFKKMEISILSRVFVLNPVVEPSTRLHVGADFFLRFRDEKKAYPGFWARGDGRDFCVNPVVKSSTRLHVGADFFLRFRDGRDVLETRTSLGVTGLGGKRCAGFLC